MKLLTVCVEYADYLALTLQRNMAAAKPERALIVTTDGDEATRKVAADCGAEVLCTDAFYRQGTWFNKGLALEEGAEQLGRQGWFAAIDADTMLPPEPDWGQWEEGRIYGAHRRLLFDPTELPRYADPLTWSGLPQIAAEAYGKYLPGCFMLFNSADPVLAKRPWFPTNWTHAGGYDTEFAGKWRKSLRHWLPFEVLHVGPDAVNWCGRATPFCNGSRPADADRRREGLNHLLAERFKRGDFSAERVR